jgi:hypothetical protein
MEPSSGSALKLRDLALYKALLIVYTTVTALHTVGNCNTKVDIIIYYNLMGPPSYMRSVVDRNVVVRRMTVLGGISECVVNIALACLLDGDMHVRSIGIYIYIYICK